VKIIYRYLFKKFLGPFALTFFFALFILLMQFLWKYVDDLVGKGLEISIVLELLFYASATFVALAAPLAVLLSSLMTFGSLGERYEIIAMKSAGISLRKLVFSLSLFSLLIGCGSFWFSDNIAPKAYYKMRMLIRNIQDQKPTLTIEEGTFYSGFDNYTIRVGKKGSNNTDIYDILLFDHTKYRGNTTFTYAKKGKMQTTDDKKYMLFYLYDGFYWDESSNQDSYEKKPLFRSTFSEQYKRFDISSFQFEKSSDNFYSTKMQALSNKEIKQMMDTVMISINQYNEGRFNNFMTSCYYFSKFAYQDSTPYIQSEMKNVPYADFNRTEKTEVLDKMLRLKNDFINELNMSREYNKYHYLNLASYYTEWYRKYVYAVACVVFFFIGAPLGSIIRKGGIGVPLVITVAFFTAYFFITIFGEKIAKGGAVSAWFGMWLSTLILIPICAFLTFQASVDSALLSSEELHRRFKQLNLKNIFTKKKNENITTYS